MADFDPSDVGALPVGSAGQRAGGWWGVWTLIATEAALFGYLIFSYLYLALDNAAQWPPDGLPKLAPGLLGTGLLLGSSVVVWAAEKLAARRHRIASAAALAVAIAMGGVFIAIQLHEWHDHPYGPATHLYGSLYFTITGFHLAHVAVGLLALAVMLVWVLLGYFDERRHAALTIGGAYWHFVDVVWLLIFATLYLSPYLIR
ncbi:cytochrome c oxidase subunit 3 [Chitinasiproducens palmae]|uniref:Cytochrome c oxidase subunit 3 n=1 Tax=Chitinasiproducens palmae TaxID=1770053 RepID=A0A1H2PIT5_9BURK|nr:cytochrome c oxidase subunit 3 [Chitinasiproducens palmae]SDV46168.1 cytochrome c oxidase subunit 3 [Chitinasiproducens palmae]